jgi:EAL domain-containing protein (putative c-di-GMP-specific phosphodiesterase class I)
MAHMLGVYVIAEGVETREQEQILRDCRCDCYQGFLFSRPVPLAEFEGLLSNGLPDID